MKVPSWFFYAAVHLPAWGFVTGSLHPTQLILGFLVALATFPLVRRLIAPPEKIDVVRFFRRVSRFLIYGMTVFIPDVVRSTLDMAYRVLHPAMPVRPGILAVRVDTGDEASFLATANHMMLTPGQIIVNIDAARHVVYIHCIDVTEPEKLRRSMEEFFERGRRMLQ